MFYKLLGILVWNGAKVVLRQKYGRTYLPKSVVAGGALAGVGVGVALLMRGRSDS
jgi:hypothetical protein